MTDEPGIQLGLAEAALVAVLLVGGLLRLEHRITLVVVLLTLALTLRHGGSRLGPLWAAGLGLSAWALFTGFAENAFGTLTFAPADDVRLALTVAGCALVAHLFRRDESA